MRGSEAPTPPDRSAPHAAQPPTSRDPQPQPPPLATRPRDEGHRCDLCDAPMQEWHCRIICTFCGYQRDCSDP